MRFLRREDGETWWLFRCQCGIEKPIRSASVKQGKTLSCGCLNDEKRRLVGMKNLIHGRNSGTHGECSGGIRSREYRVWCGIIQRCKNKKSARYADYGGRGIQVSERWAKFENFLEDMGRCPSRSHQIDRKDNDGNYEKDNCKWSTPTEQQNNTSRNRIVHVDCGHFTVAELARKLNLPYGFVYEKLVKTKLEL